MHQTICPSLGSDEALLMNLRKLSSITPTAHQSVTETNSLPAYQPVSSSDLLSGMSPPLLPLSLLSYEAGIRTYNAGRGQLQIINDVVVAPQSTRLEEEPALL